MNDNAPLEEQLTSAFPARLIGGTITPHECEECAAIREYLASRTWLEVEDVFTEQYSGSLPLLAPNAYQAYLPAWLRTAARNADSEVAGMLLINLADEPPLELFDATQCKAVLAVARHVATKNYWRVEDPSNIKHLAEVEKVWSARAA